MISESRGDDSSRLLSGGAVSEAASVTVEYKQALSRVMGLLARREYSVQEIQRKLGSEYPAEILAAVIQRCLELDWLNETRMMTVFIRSRANRGYGPIRVLQELRLKGLASESIKLALEASQMDWFAIAKSQAMRKVSDVTTLDLVARGRVLAYLQRRGFTAEQARYALTPSDDE